MFRDYEWVFVTFELSPQMHALADSRLFDTALIQHVNGVTRRQFVLVTSCDNQRTNRA